MIATGGTGNAIFSRTLCVHFAEFSGFCVYFVGHCWFVCSFSSLLLYMNRHVMYTYDYVNSAWKNNELKQSHTIEGALKSSCPVQKCVCITLYLHCDSRRYNSNEEKELCHTWRQFYRHCSLFFVTHGGNCIALVLCSLSHMAAIL
jgi:hypothetical protein